jgi:hypothetical protein
MIQDRITQIEARLASAADVPSATRDELQTLLAQLKAEVATLTGTHDAQAQSIARSTDAAIALAAQPAEGSTPAVLDELRASVEGFEASHPRLVQVVDRIALTLSNMGI